WFILTTISLFFGYIGLITGFYYLLIIPLIFLGPLLIAGLEISHDYLKTNNFIIKSYFSYIFKSFKRGFLGFLLTFLVYLVLFTDLVYFLRKGVDSIFMLILAVLVLYIIIFFSMLQAFFWGFLVLDKENKIRNVFKNAFLVTLDNIVFSFIWFLIVLIISSVLIFTGFGMALLLLNFLSLMILNASIEMGSEYENIDIGELGLK
ncbi:MAG: hypothetical protein K9K76_10130, partial [Halanaerobiales bacterium]|nr:hypothetical protein [Halanaerobiales bacterium]